MTTVPNQKTVCVHREKPTSDFLGIKNENWMYASRDLGAHALRLYLYLAANANGYTFALSPADIRQRVGIPNSTYRDQFQILIDKGYLVPNSGNSYDFYELPQTRPVVMIEESAPLVRGNSKSTETAPPWTAPVPNKTAENREIYNKDTPIDNIINIAVPEVKVVKITPPNAFGKKRPEHTPKPNPVAETFQF